MSQDRVKFKQEIVQPFTSLTLSYPRDSAFQSLGLEKKKSKKKLRKNEKEKYKNRLSLDSCFTQKEPTTTFKKDESEFSFDLKAKPNAKAISFHCNPLDKSVQKGQKMAKHKRQQESKRNPRLELEPEVATEPTELKLEVELEFEPKSGAKPSLEIETELEPKPEILQLVPDKRIPPKLDDTNQREEDFYFVVNNGPLMPQLPWNETQREILRQRIKDNEQRDIGKNIREELLSTIAFRNKRLNVLCSKLADDATFTHLQTQLFSQIFLRGFSLQDGKSLDPFESKSWTKAEWDKVQPQRVKFLNELKWIADLESQEKRFLLVELYKSVYKKLIQEWDAPREYKYKRDSINDTQTEDQQKFYDFRSLKSIESFASIYFLSEGEKKNLPSTKFLSIANVLRLVHSWQIRKESTVLLESTLKRNDSLSPHFWPKLGF